MSSALRHGGVSRANRLTVSLEQRAPVPPAPSSGPTSSHCHACSVHTSGSLRGSAVVLPPSQYREPDGRTKPLPLSCCPSMSPWLAVVAGKLQGPLPWEEVVSRPHTATNSEVDSPRSGDQHLEQPLQLHVGNGSLGLGDVLAAPAADSAAASHVDDPMQQILTQVALVVMCWGWHECINSNIVNNRTEISAATHCITVTCS